MSWLLGKKLKDNPVFPFGSSSSSSSSASAPASTSDVNAPASVPRESTAELDAAKAPASGAVSAAPVHTTRSDLLTVSVINGQGLTLPSGTTLASPSTDQAGPSKMAQRQRHASLPYVVLEFDKNEVLIMASGGTLEAPQWQFSANFDVSRKAEVMLHVYLRSEAVASSGQQASILAPPAIQPSMKQHLSPNANQFMGGNDLYMGMAKLVPSFENSHTIDTWLPLMGSTGKIRVQMAFRSQLGTSLNIESFELLKVIGKGSFGKVMQVRKRDTSRIYALKIIRKAHIISRSEVTHTLAERTVLAQVNSPFIVPLKFSFQSPDKLYLGLAFVNGGELFHHLQREGRFSEERSRFYAAELFCALEHLHSFNVIYRDLKPENILLDYTGHIALCDFGLCKLNMGDQETTNTFCGTPEYLAPELLLGRGYTKAVDWWTLGVLLYEMLTGLPPFYSEDVNEMYRKILNDPLIFPHDVQYEARDILVRLLQRNPKERLGSLANGVADIKNHPFFTKHIDWDLLLAKKVQPPFKPGVASAFDTSNFDPEFTNEPAMDSVVDDSHMISDAVQEQFAGFSYTAAPENASGDGLWS